MPNLIIDGIGDAIAKSSAYKIYVCNVMTQAGETDGYTASEHVQALVDHTGKGIINACMVNVAQAPGDALERYKEENSFPVKADAEKIKEMGYTVIATDLLGVDSYVRHDSAKLTQALIHLIEKHRVIKR